MFAIVSEGGISYDLAWGMTNRQRKRWLEMMKDKNKRQKSEMDRAKSKGKTPSGLR